MRGCSWSPAPASIPGCCRTSRAWTSAVTCPISSSTWRAPMRPSCKADCPRRWNWSPPGGRSSTSRCAATGNSSTSSPTGSTTTGPACGWITRRPQQTCCPPRCGPHWHKRTPDPVTGRSPEVVRTAPPRVSPHCWMASDRTTTKGVGMTRPGTGVSQWVVVDEGWGRKAVDFATLSEPGNCREYVTVHHGLGVDAGDRLLDVACGSGLAVELARLRGASCCGIDASAPLVAVARDRNPGCAIRVCDMHGLPWDPASFDVVTSFRGIWGTTPDAVAEIYRVLRPGGRAGMTVWGHLKVSPGAWALAPFRLAAAEKVGNQAGMVALGRPGAGEHLLASYGFVDVERLDVPFAWEFADPELYARALASTGPAYEAIQNVGEGEFYRAAVEQAEGQLRDGLPLRAEIKVVGYLARKPEGAKRA